MTSLQVFHSQLVNAVSEEIDTGGEITSLFDLGFIFERDGTVGLDEDVLNQAANNNFDGVKTFLLGDDNKNITGWADKINTQIRSATMSGTGLIAAEKKASESQLIRMNAQITQSEERLDRRYEIMTKQFIELDKYMNSMQSISTYLSQQFESFYGATKDNY